VRASAKLPVFHSTMPGSVMASLSPTMRRLVFSIRTANTRGSASTAIRSLSAQAESWLSAFKAHLAESGLGHISEIFDGDPPHRPVGCIAQAWSVAELLRATVEDVYGRRPGGSNPTKIAASVKCVA
jgi:glycogen debranching enzyme